MQYAPQYRLPFPSQTAYFCRTLVWNKAGPRRKQSLTASPSLATCDCAIARGALGRFAFASAGPATNQSRHHVLADVIRLGHVLAERSRVHGSDVEAGSQFSIRSSLDRGRDLPDGN